MDTVRFAFISDGDVFHYLNLPNNEDLAGVIAGLRSRPIVVEVPEQFSDGYIGSNWKYINDEFVYVEKKPINTSPNDYEVE